jgi:hypothetical protein
MINDEIIAKHIKNAVEADTPNVLDNIMMEINKADSSQKVNKKIFFRYRYVVAVFSCLLVMFICYSVYNSFYIPSDINYFASQNKPSSSSCNPLASQINKYYLPITPSQYPTNNMYAPWGPLSFDELLNGQNVGNSQSNLNVTSVVILCTLENIGIYRRINENATIYAPETIFGSYIYTVKINKVLYGCINDNIGDYIAVNEKVCAFPNSEIQASNKASFNGWDFYPYTVRPRSEYDLQIGNQYVMFLSAKDKTDCYELLWNGFGVFSINYINNEAKTDSLSVIESKYNNESVKDPLTDSILYKICALHVKNDFLSDKN